MLYFEAHLSNGEVLKSLDAKNNGVTEEQLKQAFERMGNLKSFSMETSEGKAFIHPDCIVYIIVKMD